MFPRHSLKMRIWLIAWLGAAVFGQNALQPGGRIAGVVLRDSDGAPLRRARVVLRPLEAGTPALGADANDKGAFEIRNIPRGTYSLTAQRDGYLETSIFLRGTLRMPQRFFIGPGQMISGVTFRLKPWATLAGKILVQRRRSRGGRSGAALPRVSPARAPRIHRRPQHGKPTIMETTGSTILRQGSYYVAGVYERAPTREVEDQAPTDDAGRETPGETYADHVLSRHSQVERGRTGPVALRW
jgi:hypothetical protein